MRRLSQFVVVLVCVFLISGCGIHTVLPEYSMPDQDINAKVSDGLTRVVFFNTSNFLATGLDGSGKINIMINDKNVASLKNGRYVQLFLPSNSYDVRLSHWDLLTFNTDHKINIGKEDVYIKVYSKATSTDYMIVNSLPEDFELKYKNAL